MVDGIEQCLYIDLALLTSGIDHDLDITSRSHFAVKSFRLPFIAVVEIQFLRELLQRRIQQHILSVKNDDRINDILKVTHLMS